MFASEYSFRLIKGTSTEKMKLLIGVFIAFSLAALADAEMENGMSNKCSQRTRLHIHKGKISNAFCQLNVPTFI